MAASASNLKPKPHRLRQPSNFGNEMGEAPMSPIAQTGPVMRMSSNAIHEMDASMSMSMCMSTGMSTSISMHEYQSEMGVDEMPVAMEHSNSLSMDSSMSAAGINLNVSMPLSQETNESISMIYSLSTEEIYTLISMSESVDFAIISSDELMSMDVGLSDEIENMSMPTDLDDMSMPMGLGMSMDAADDGVEISTTTPTSTPETSIEFNATMTTAAPQIDMSKESSMPVSQELEGLDTDMSIGMESNASLTETNVSIPEINASVPVPEMNVSIPVENTTNSTALPVIAVVGGGAAGKQPSSHADPR